MPTQSFFFSSSPLAGAQNVSADGSQFEVNFNTPLEVPSTATTCEAGIANASVWNTSYNISAAFGNNQFQVLYGGATHTLTIDDGLYSLENLNGYIQKGLFNLAAIPAGTFVLSGDDATQRAIITMSQVGDAVNFQAPESCAAILGFTPAQVGPATAAGQHFYSQGEAQLNRTNLYLITSDLVAEGLPVNALARGVIGQVPITSNPGEQVNYQPPQVLWFQAEELIGRPRMNVRFSLVNQNLQATPTSGDSYSFVLQIRWS